MDHVNYGSWAEYMSALFRRFHPGARSVLEVACGTGSLALLLCASGYELTCMDQSPEMLRVAMDKFRNVGRRARFVAGSMTDIPFAAKFHAVISIYDSVNYLMDITDFKRAVRETALVTGEGGLFIFDVCTVRNSELFFRDGEMFETYDDIAYERICRYHSRTRIQENRFVISRNGKTLGIEQHRQRIYYLEEIAGMFEDSPFREVGRFDDMSFSPGTENSDRVHFVFRKV
jgi:ubiquinone/menaquinone biosynthesis C-methylase UbiE